MHKETTGGGLEREGSFLNPRKNRVKRGRLNRPRVRASPARSGNVSAQDRDRNVVLILQEEFGVRQGLFLVATMLEGSEVWELVEETIPCSQVTREMSLYEFVLAILLGMYVGFARLNQ